MKKYMILLVGILLLVVSFVWMVVSQESVGPFLVLSGISGAVIVEGIHRIVKGQLEDGRTEIREIKGTDRVIE